MICYLILDLMLSYLKYVDQSIGFKEKLEAIDMETETEYGSARIYRDIHILVCILSCNILFTLVYIFIFLEISWIKIGQGWIKSC